MHELQDEAEVQVVQVDRQARQDPSLSQNPFLHVMHSLKLQVEHSAGQQKVL